MKISKKIQIKIADKNLLAALQSNHTGLYTMHMMISYPPTLNADMKWDAPEETQAILKHRHKSLDPIKVTFKKHGLRVKSIVSHDIINTADISPTPGVIYLLPYIGRAMITGTPEQLLQTLEIKEVSKAFGSPPASNIDSRVEKDAHSRDRHLHRMERRIHTVNER